MDRPVSKTPDLAVLSAATTLPALRQDIEFSEIGGNEPDAGSWVIYDPLRNRYFKINAATKDLLLLWREGMTLAELAEATTSRLQMSINIEQLGGLVAFVSRNNLAVDSSNDAWRKIAARAKSETPARFSQLLHNYLFFKVPLFHPQHALKAALPWVEIFYRWSTAVAIGLTGLIGVYLASRQWDGFTHTFQNFFSMEGAVWFGLCLIVVKSAHELGHAFTAVRFGCHVPTMGVAFMVMTPMLYTDVSDAWRLSSRRERLLIHASGVIVELMIACVATFAWTFLSDGPVRGAVFMIAATSWILSLGLNLNPFMRFDGYFLLADLLRIDNLQSRAFELGRWKLRRLLFAPSLEPPERLPRRLQNGLILFAWGTWIYRLVVFTGIAILIYHFFFKALGIFLFAVEIWFFIAKPIFQEIAAWRKIPHQAGLQTRTTVTAGIGLVACLIIFVPWSSKVEIPAVLSAADLTQVYPVRPARVVSVHAARGDVVATGATLAVLDAPEVEKELSDTVTNIELIKLRLGRTMVDQDDREQYLVLSRKLSGLQNKFEGLQQERDELVVRAPVAGTVLELDPDLHPGRWIKKSDLIGLIASQKHYVVRGYVAEVDLARIKSASAGRFIPDDLTQPSVPVMLTRMARTGASQIDIPELASVHGGPIAVQTDASQKLSPVGAQYLAELTPTNANRSPNQLVRGVVELDGKSTSIFMRIVRTSWQVLVRESGF